MEENGHGTFGRGSRSLFYRNSIDTTRFGEKPRTSENKGSLRVIKTTSVNGKEERSPEEKDESS